MWYAELSFLERLCVRRLLTPVQEPHLSTLASNAPGLVLHLLRHSTLPASILPVQLCTSRHPSWAFMTFSGPLFEANSVIQKEIWPPDWIVMTKYALGPFFSSLIVPECKSIGLQSHSSRAEHTRRTDEYLALKAASRQSFRSSPQGPITPVPSRKPRSTSSATNTSTRISKPSQPCPKESKIPYPTGTLVHLHPLPLRVTKPALTAFLSHNVFVWASKKASIGQSKSDPASQLRIAHIVLRPSATADATSATVRCCTDVDAENLIDAMEARGRRMVDAEDAKGVKAGEGERLKPELLRGDRERAFWEELRASTIRRELKIERQMKRKREGDDDEI